VARRTTKAEEPTGLVLEVVPLAQMRPAGWNPRRIDPFQLDALKASMTEFGSVEPVVLDQNGMIVGGHQRYLAATQLGWSELPAVRVNLTARQAKLLNLALNRISGDWDEGALARVIASVLDGEPPTALLVAGFPEDEVAQILERLSEPEAPGAFPEPGDDTDYRCPSCGYEWSGPPR
jgi:ParB-like chromosome segregation protein Spo0J